MGLDRGHIIWFGSPNRTRTSDPPGFWFRLRAADSARPSRASVSVVSVIRFLLVLCSQWTGDIQEVVSHQIDKRPVLRNEPSGVDLQLFLGQCQF